MDAATTWHVISEVGRVLDAEVAYRNQENRMGQAQIPPIIYHHKPPLDESPKMSSILGTQNLTSTVKANIQAAKERAQRMAQGNVDALGKVNEAIQVGENINQSLENDAADLLKELGQFSNGAPA